MVDSSAAQIDKPEYATQWIYKLMASQMAYDGLLNFQEASISALPLLDKHKTQVRVPSAVSNVFR